MSTLTLTFTMSHEAYEARAAMYGLRSLAALNRIDQIARTALKHDGDLIRSLEEIRREVTEATEGLE